MFWQWLRGSGIDNQFRRALRVCWVLPLVTGCQMHQMYLSAVPEPVLPASGTAAEVELTSAATPLPAAPDPPDSVVSLATVDAEEIKVEDARPMALGEAIDTALARNPDLVALRQNVPVSRAAWAAAKVYPYNPSVTVNVAPYAEDITGDQLAVKNAVSVVQTFELAHQTQRREQTAWAELIRTQRELAHTELMVVAETERRYFNAVYRQELHAHAKALAELDEQLLEVLERRFQAGQSTAADVSLARIEARTARQQADLASAAWEESRRALQQYLGLSSSESVVFAKKLSEWRASPASGTLQAVIGDRPAAQTGTEEEDTQPGEAELDTLVGQRPDVQAAMADLRAAWAQLKLARASRIPNVGFGPTYERDESGTVFVGLEVQTDLPVVDNGRAKVCEWETVVRQKDVALRQLQVKARLEIEAAWERYRRACAVVEEFQDQKADAWDEEIRAVTDLFTAGQTDLLTVYTVRSKVIDFKKGYLDALYELTQAAAEVTAATGIPPTNLLTWDPEAPQP